MSYKTMQTILTIVALSFTILAQTTYSQSITGQCTTAIVSLAPCLGYITGNSSAPSSSCCTQLSSVVKTNALCLCTLLNGGGSTFGININQTQALTLPGSCKIQTPPISQCKGASGPASAPSGSPAPSTSTPSTPSDSTPSTPSGVPGSKTSPTTTDNSPSGSYKSTASGLFSSLFIVASLAMF